MKTVKEIIEDYQLALSVDEEYAVIEQALDEAYNKALEDLEGVEIINPKLVNDGFGEFPDVYQLTGANVLQIKEKLKK